MRTRYIPSIVMLLAGTITCVFCLVKSYSAVSTLKILLAVLVIFYIIGLIARNLINKIITTDLKQPEDMDVATEGNDTVAEEEENPASENKVM